MLGICRGTLGRLLQTRLFSAESVSLKAKKVGVIGLGNVGNALIKKAVKHGGMMGFGPTALTVSLDPASLL